MTTELWAPQERTLVKSKDGHGLRIILPSRLELVNKARYPNDFRPPLGGGAATAWEFTNTSRTDLLDGTFDLDTDTFFMNLYLSTTDLGDTSTTNPATNEHANANGYTTGGISLAQLVLSGTITVTVDIATDPVWTASGGSIVCREAAIYESGGNILVFTVLDGADITVTTGNTLTVAANASGVFTLSGA